jgi:hypothetical protein
VKKRHHLTRRPWGWHVRIRRDSAITQKYFADAHYGGCRKAELAARAWRDRQLAKLPDPTPRGRKPGLSQELSSNNRSGLPGVYRTVRTNRWYRKKDQSWAERSQAYWCCSWREQGQRYDRSWSVGRLGEEKARQKAWQFRKRKVREIRAALSASGR